MSAASKLALHIRQWRGASQPEAHLEDVVARLRDVSVSTEQEFLRIGERLQDIVAGANQQRSGIASLVQSAGQMAGGEIERVLEEVSRRTGTMGASSGGGDKYEDLLATVRAVREPLRGLADAVRALRVVGVITRVESARLGLQGAGFDALAAEVGSLADAIDGKSRAILAAVERVAELLVRTRRETATMERRQQAGIAAMTTECQSGIGALQQQEERIAATSGELDQRWQAFTTDVGDVVAALQTHDSTRQRLEHIADALGEAAREHSRSPRARHLIALQAAQLEEAREGFLNAVTEIQSDLDRLGHTVTDCAAMARELSAARSESGGGFGGELERRLEVIAATVSELAESRRATAQAAGEVRHACAEMSAFVAEIGTIGERMLRLALNAQIQAVHLAETGVVMEAVAEGIRSSSASASASAHAAGEALRGVEQAAEGMNVLAGSGADAAVTEAADLSRRIRADAAGINHADQNSARVLTSLVTASADLSAGIDVLRESIHAGRVVGEAADFCLTRLREISAARSGGGYGAAHTAEVLAHLGRKYTMHSERRAHEAFVGASSAPALPAHAASAAGSEFGENVELF